MFETQPEGPFDALLEKELQLKNLRTDSLPTLVLRAVSDTEHCEAVCHLLHQNTSVSGLVFKTDDKRSSYGESRLLEGEWLHLISVFQAKNRIHRLSFVGADIPFFVIPTTLWQFRNLTYLKLKKISGFEWDEEKWNVLSAAIHGHPSLKSFTMDFSGPACDELLWEHSPNDALTEALATTVPTLKEYKQIGLHKNSIYSEMQAPMLSSMAYIVSLISSDSMEKLVYRYSGFHSMKYAYALPKALETTHLRQLSLRCNGIDGPTACLIIQGVRENSSIEKLDLCENDFGMYPGVTSAIVTMLERNTTLESLNLSDCSFDTASHIEIISALRTNTSLFNLKLGGSAMTNLMLVDEYDNDDGTILYNPATAELMYELRALVAAGTHNRNRTLQRLQISTDDCEINSYEKGMCWSRPNLQAAVDAIEFGLKVNIAGANVLGGRVNQTKVGRKDWIETLVAGREDAGVLDFFLRLNPDVYCAKGCYV